MDSCQMCTGIIVIGRVLIDFDGIYSMLIKKACIDDCCRKKNKFKQLLKLVFYLRCYITILT